MFSFEHHDYSHISVDFTLPRKTAACCCAVAILVFTSQALIAADDEIDSEHIFGITHGSDIGKKGEVEGHIEPAAAIQKRFGTYFATTQFAQIKYTITDNFRIAPGVFATTHDIQNLPGFDNRRRAAFGGGTVELRYRLLDRETRPFGLTLSAEPGWNRIDELTGERVVQYGSQFAILIDKEIIPNRLFGAINFIYDLSATRLHSAGEWSHESTVFTNLSLTNQFLPGIFVGAEARYGQTYDGLGLDRLKGEAFYIGPTFFVKVGKNAGLSGGWSFQIAGKEVNIPGTLDLANFERQRVQLTFNVLLNP